MKNIIIFIIVLTVCFAAFYLMVINFPPSKITNKGPDKRDFVIDSLKFEITYRDSLIKSVLKADSIRYASYDKIIRNIKFLPDSTRKRIARERMEWYRNTRHY
jgi:hypothetical protein